MRSIGPHNNEIWAALFGSLLGDAYAEKRNNATRITFQQESSNMEHLHNTWKIFSQAGYCPDVKPIMKTRLGAGGKKRYVCRFKTFTYGSFNWIHDSFYSNGVKFVPLNITEYLSPLALAIWIMDDGNRQGTGVKLSTNSFTHEDVLRLCNVLATKYGLKATAVITGYGKKYGKVQYALYIHTASIPKLRSIVKPYFVDSMLYKLSL
jgi:ubiquinol-cytochrome c reductase cytochrome b subunit